MSYEVYEGKNKQERKGESIKQKSFDSKRFVLSENPEMRKRLKILSGAIDKFKEEHPEVISLSLFGSFTKGYAVEDSDIDGCLNVDDSKMRHENREKWHYSEFMGPTGFIKFLKDQFKEKGIDMDGKISIEPNYISEDYIEKTIGMGGDNFKLFLMQVSNGAKKYRRAIFDTLRSLGGERGETAWRRIMDFLCDWENNGLPPEVIQQKRKLYPDTLDAGEKKFL